MSDLISRVGVASCDMLCEPPSVTTVCQLFAQSIQTQYNTSGVSDGGRMYVVSLWSPKKCYGVSLAYGPSGTGKTMSLRCGLALFGAHNQHIFQQGILQFFANRCSESTGIDDPSHTNDLAELLLSVTKRANITRGTNKPQSSPIVAANFSLQDKVSH